MRFIHGITATCIVALLGGCSKPKEAEIEAPAPVQVSVVAQDTIRRTVAGDGTLWPRNQASVMPKIAAPVQRFLVQRGDHGGRQRLRHVADTTADQALGSLGIRLAENFHAPGNLGEEVAGFELEVVVVEEGHFQ